jgi:L-threonylcarbamoyladenylate synthase
MALLTLQQAAEALAAGSVVGVPTETFYGLAADVRNPRAVASVLALKRRAPNAPSPVLVRSIEAASELLTTPLSVEARQVMATFWPGALTLVLPDAQPWLPKEVVSDGSVALRQDGHPALAKLLALAACDVTGTSANLAGSPALRHGSEVSELFGGDDRYAGHIGVESLGASPSTIVRLDGRRAETLRVGAVAVADVEEVLERAAASQSDG